MTIPVLMASIALFILLVLSTVLIIFAFRELIKKIQDKNAKSIIYYSLIIPIYTAMIMYLTYIYIAAVF